MAALDRLTVNHDLLGHSRAGVMGGQDLRGDSGILMGDLHVGGISCVQTGERENNDIENGILSIDPYSFFYYY